MDQIVLNHVTKQFTTKTLGTVTAVNDFNLTIKVVQHTPRMA